MKHVLHKITLFTAAAMLTLSTFANGFEYNGIHYILDESTKTASVTYTGDTPETNTYSGEIELPTKFKYNNEYYRVTSIGDKAFYGCKGISYINISGLITKIGSESFGSNNMTSLIIPDNVTTIADDAFKGSNISIFMLGAMENYSFLGNVSTTTPVFAPEASLQKIMETWKGTAKSIEQDYYLIDVSTITTTAFRLEKTEYYSLPNAPMFEFSSVITHGVEIYADEETGAFSWDGMNPGETCEYVINYNIDGEDLAEIIKLKARNPQVTCEESVITATSFTAKITGEEEGLYTPTETGIVIDGTKYTADDNGKVEVTSLTENKEYTAKPYAVYKGKTYYGDEFTFTAKNSTNIAGVTESETKVSLNNNSSNGYIEVMISGSNDANYSIINITGQKETEGTLMGENKVNTIQTNEFTPGIYLLNVTGNKLNKTVKFIIR